MEDLTRNIKIANHITSLLQGSPEGLDIKNRMAEGQLIPNQLMIQLLVKGMMARPSKVSKGGITPMGSRITVIVGALKIFKLDF